MRSCGGCLDGCACMPSETRAVFAAERVPRLLQRVTARPAVAHASNPLTTSVAREKPRSRRVEAPRLEEYPCAHTRITSRSRSESAGSAWPDAGSRHQYRTDKGTWIEPGMTPLSSRASAQRAPAPCGERRSHPLRTSKTALSSPLTLETGSVGSCRPSPRVRRIGRGS